MEKSPRVEEIPLVAGCARLPDSHMREHVFVVSSPLTFTLDGVFAGRATRSLNA